MLFATASEITLLWEPSYKLFLFRSIKGSKINSFKILESIIPSIYSKHALYCLPLAFNVKSRSFMSLFISKLYFVCKNSLVTFKLEKTFVVFVFSLYSSLVLFK